MLDCRAILVSGCVHRIYLWRLHPQRQPIGATAAIAAIAATPSRFAMSPSASSYGAARLRTLALEAECIVCIGCWCLAGDGPEEAIVIEELPFFFSGNSAEYTSTVSLGGGPDVFFTFTSATEVREGFFFLKKKKSSILGMLNDTDVELEQNVTASVDTCLSSYDTEIGIYTLSPSGGLMLEVSNDDSSFCPGEITRSRIEFTFEAGVQYFVVVVRRK